MTPNYDNLNHWFKHKTRFSLWTIGASVVFIVIFSFFINSYIQKSKSLSKYLYVSAETSQSALEAGDWDLLLKHLESSTNSNIFFNVELYNNSKDIVLAGPIGKENFGFLKLCKNQPLSTSEGLSVKACSNIFASTELISMILIILFATFFATLSTKLYQSKAKGFLSKLSFQLEQLSNMINDQPFDDFEQPINQEISELQIVSSKVLELIKKAKESSKQKALAELAAQVSHDIKSPLMALSTISNLNNDLDPKFQNLLDNCINRIKDISDDMLINYRNVNTGKKTTDETLFHDKNDFSPTPLNQMISSIIDEKRSPSTDNFSIKFIDDIKDPQFIKLKQSTFKRILSNIINNSIEAKTEDSLRVLVKISRDYKNPKNIVVEIADNGIGIPQILLNQVFDKNKSFNKKHGTGLGLSYTKNEIEKNGGEVNITSREGIGTIITLSIPINETPPFVHKNLNIAQNSQFAKGVI